MKKSTISSICFRKNTDRVIFKITEDNIIKYIILDRKTFEDLIRTSINNFFNELCYSNEITNNNNIIRVNGKIINVDTFEEMIDMTLSDLNTLLNYLNHKNINRDDIYLKYKLANKGLKQGSRFTNYVYVKKGSSALMDKKWFDVNPLMYKYEDQIAKIINRSVCNEPELLNLLFDDDIQFVFDKETLIPLAKI